MVRHVLLFKLKEMEPKQKAEVANEIKSRLLALKDTVSAISKIEVGVNQNPAEAFDIALITEHKDWAELAEYRDHPDHVAVAKFIGQYRAERSCADYEF